MFQKSRRSGHLRLQPLLLPSPRLLLLLRLLLVRLREHARGVHVLATAEEWKGEELEQPRNRP